MKDSHVTYDELIKYQFKLISGQEAEKIAAHLKECSDCRNQLEQIKQRFAALDVLRDDVTASESLISQALARVDKKARIRKFWPPWGPPRET